MRVAPILAWIASWVVIEQMMGNTLVGAVESIEPYIDQIKREWQQQHPADASGDTPGNTIESQSSDFIEPYISRIKTELNSEPQTTGKSEINYTEKVRASHPEWKNPQIGESFSETEKQKLPTKAEGGAIQSVLNGDSELHPKKVGEVHHAFGFRYGAALTRNLTAPKGVQLRNFNDVYGSNYAPDLSLFFDFQIFHSRSLGNIGILTMAGIAAYSGTGQLSIPIQRPAGNGTFPLTSSTKFQFFTAPVVVALDYRLNLLKYLQLFGVVGPNIVGYLENRNDGVSGQQGYSMGLFASAGVSILLDWMFPSGAWNLYSTFGIQHDYLTIEFSDYTTFSGLVNMNIYGISAGITFEY